MMSLSLSFKEYAISQKSSTETDNQENMPPAIHVQEDSSSNCEFRNELGFNDQHTSKSELNTFQSGDIFRPMVSEDEEEKQHELKQVRQITIFGYRKASEEFQKKYSLLTRQQSDLSDNLIDLGVINKGPNENTRLLFNKESQQYLIQKKAKKFDDRSWDEYLALSKLKESDNPSLIKIVALDYRSFEKSFSVTLENYRGYLSDFLEFTKKYGHTWSAEDVRELFFQIKGQIKALKALNLVPADITPVNIILDKAGCIKILGNRCSQTVLPQGIQETDEKEKTEFYDQEAEDTLKNKRKPKMDTNEVALASVEKTINEIMKTNKIEGDIRSLKKDHKNLERTNQIKILLTLGSEYDIYLFDKGFGKYLTPGRCKKLLCFIESNIFAGITEWLQVKLEKLNSQEEVRVVYYLWGEILKERGKYPDAMHFFEKCEKETHDLKLDDELTSDLYNTMGITAIFNFSLKLAEKYHKKSLKMKKRKHGKLSLPVAREYLSFGLNHLQQGDTQKALKICENSKAILESMPKSKESKKSLILLLFANHNIALAKQEQGLPDEALKLESDCITDFEMIHGRNHRMVAVCLAGLGKCHYQLGHISEALYWFEQSVEILKEVAPESYGYALCFGYVGTCLSVCDRKQEAVLRYEQGLALLEKNHRRNPYIFIFLANIGEICLDLKQYEKAEEYFHRCLEGYSKITSPDVHYSVGIYQNKWDLWFAKDEQKERAREIYANNMQMIKEFPERHPEVALFKQRLGQIYIHQKQYIDASKILVAAYRMMGEMTSYKSVDVALCLKYLLQAFDMKKKDEVKRKCFENWRNFKM